MWKLFRSSAPKAPSGASNLHINEIVTNNSAPDTGILYTRPLESPSIGPLYSPTKPRVSDVCWPSYVLRQLTTDSAVRHQPVLESVQKQRITTWVSELCFPHECLLPQFRLGSASQPPSVRQLAGTA